MNIKGVNVEPIDVSKMPSKGLFYVDNINIWMIPITPAESESWKHLTSTELSESRQMIYELMVNHVMVSSLTQGTMSLNDIMWIDYLWLVIKLREVSGLDPLPITLVNGKMTFLTTDKLVAMNDAEDMMKLYSSEDRCLIFDCKDKTIPMFMPSIGITVMSNNIMSGLGGNEAVIKNHLLQNVIKAIPLLIGDWKFISQMSAEEVYIYSVNFLNFISNYEMDIWRKFISVRDDIAKACNSVMVDTENGPMKFAYNFNFSGLFCS